MSRIPAVFPEHLSRAHQEFMPIDPDTPENQQANAFVTESAPDGHRKLQGLEGSKGMNRSQLLETAQRTLDSRDPDEKKTEDWLAYW